MRPRRRRYAAAVCIPGSARNRCGFLEAACLLQEKLACRAHQDVASKGLSSVCDCGRTHRSLGRLNESSPDISYDTISRTPSLIPQRVPVAASAGCTCHMGSPNRNC